MSDILSVVFVEESVVGIGDIVDIDSSTATGTIGADSITGGTYAIGGFYVGIVISAEDPCFFTNSNPCVLLWTLVSGTLPPGVVLDPTLGLQNGNPGTVLALGHGPGEFVVAVSNACGDTAQETFNVATVVPPPPEPTICPSWDLGALWTVSVACAKSPNTFGLRRVADGITADSYAVSNTATNVVAGQVYFIEFVARSSGGANGTVSVGLRFFDVDGVQLSEAQVNSTGSPTDWATFYGSVTAPANAVTAKPFIKATGHLVGTWCVNFPFIARQDTNFVLSGLRHYYDDYTAYR